MLESDCKDKLNKFIKSRFANLQRIIFKFCSGMQIFQRDHTHNNERGNCTLYQSFEGFKYKTSKSYC